MVRLAVPSDSEEIADLHIRVWRAAYRGQVPDALLDAMDVSSRTAAWRQRILDPSNVVLVSVDADAIVGFCQVMPSRDAYAEPRVAELAALYVAQERWRSGIGSAILDAAVEAARERDFIRMTLWVLASNTSAQAFYEARGFVMDGHTKLDSRPGASLHEIRYSRRLLA